jgi:hypothetical protein
VTIQRPGADPAHPDSPVADRQDEHLQVRNPGPSAHPAVDESDCLEQGVRQVGRTRAQAFAGRSCGETQRRCPAPVGCLIGDRHE